MRPAAKSTRVVPAALPAASWPTTAAFGRRRLTRTFARAELKLRWSGMLDALRLSLTTHGGGACFCVCRLAREREALGLLFSHGGGSASVRGRLASTCPRMRSMRWEWHAKSLSNISCVQPSCGKRLLILPVATSFLNCDFWFDCI